MSGPWERYGAPQATEGPWSRYAPSPPPEPRNAPGVLERVATGAGDIVQGGAQMLVNALPEGVVNTVNRAAEAVGIPGATAEQINAQTAQRERDYQARRGPDAGFDWARMLGNVAAGVPLAVAMPGAGTLAGSVVSGATQGAALSALQPVAEGDYWTEKGTQAMTGGALGAVAGPAGYALGRAIAPRVDPNVRAMREAGVTMTPGQIMGGQARQIENSATSIPVVGGQVREAQLRSLESFNRATANRVLRPLGQTVPRDVPVGRDLVEEVGRRVGQAYDDVLAKVKPFGPDQQFVSEIARARAAIPTTQSREAFDGVLTREVIERLQTNALDGETYKTVTSILGTRASGYKGSSIQGERDVGDALQGVQRAFQRLLERTNPAQRAALQKADTAYAGYLRMQTAAGMQGAGEGVFTPAHLSAAVRQTDRSLRRSAFARGDALLQDFSDAAKAKLPSNVPDSGTAGRSALMAALGAGAYGVGVPPAAIGAGAAAYGAYSPVGQTALNALLLANRPAAVTAAGRALAQSGGLAAAPLAPMLANRPQDPRNQNR